MKSEQKKACIILAGGRIEQDFVRNQIDDIIQKYSSIFTIACDKGLEAFQVLNQKPDLILGDFDSVRPDVLDRFSDDQNQNFLRFPAEKDDTDLALAAECAIREHADVIYIFGATGTRLDHVMGGIQILYRLNQSGIAAYIMDSHNRIQILGEGTHSFAKENHFGTYISFLPFTDTAEEITMKGFKYQTDHIKLEKGTTLGISNEIAEENCEIEIGKGILLCIESRD